MKKRKTDQQKHKRWLAVIVGIVVILTVICIVYVNDYYRADDLSAGALQTDEAVAVEWIADDIVAFIPAASEGTIAGLIFYPGGKVEYTAYAPLLHELAESGVLCLLCRMPCNLAVLDVNAAGGLQEKYPQVENWYIGGHSLGGSMAAAYVAEHIDDFDGLLLLAAYSTKDISDSGLRVLSVYGTQDEVLNMEKYTGNLSNLPDDTKECIIEGGCHAQFGSYGQQEGDGVPEISGEEQREITVEAVMELVEELDDFKGGMAENYVNIQLTINGYQTCYWESERGAEVDFVI
ncbi:MAG: alpha/beta hydrolase [Roseburia sp.]|nr:alpha/beta hydrolase [Roseburia sp.]